MHAKKHRPCEGGRSVKDLRVCCTPLPLCCHPRSIQYLCHSLCISCVRQQRRVPGKARGDWGAELGQIPFTMHISCVFDHVNSNKLARQEEGGIALRPMLHGVTLLVAQAIAKRGRQGRLEALMGVKKRGTKNPAMTDVFCHDPKKMNGLAGRKFHSN